MEKDMIGIIGHSNEKMTLRETIAKSSGYSKEIINTRDIYPLVGVSLLARNYYESTLEEKSVMVEEEIKRYIANKLLYCGYFISDKEAIQTELSELLTKLYELIGNDKEIVHQVTHYILGLFTEIQGYQVIWDIEEDESLIINPVLEEKEGTLDKLKTHMDTNPITTFNLVFNYYLSKCNKNDLTRTRKKEELPKTGE